MHACTPPPAFIIIMILPQHNSTIKTSQLSFNLGCVTGITGVAGTFAKTRDAQPQPRCVASSSVLSESDPVQLIGSSGRDNVIRYSPRDARRETRPFRSAFQLANPHHRFICDPTRPDGNVPAVHRLTLITRAPSSFRRDVRYDWSPLSCEVHFVPLRVLPLRHATNRLYIACNVTSYFFASLNTSIW